jgi:alpha-L-fucosidase
MPGEAGAVSHNAPGWKQFLGSGDPDGGVWSPGMVDVPLRGANKVHNWFWAPNQDEAAQPTDKLVGMYVRSVGRNCNFIIGEVITPDGLVPASDLQRLAEFGRELKRRWGRPVAETAGIGMSVEVKLPPAARITSVVIMEDIARGERIQSYTLAGQLPDGQWQELARGQSIGHKRIEQFSAIEVTVVRLAVARSKGEPRLRKLAACS